MIRWLLPCGLVTVIVGCTSTGDAGTVDSTATSTVVELPTAVSDPQTATPLRACPATYPGIVAIDPASGSYLWNHCGTADEQLRVIGLRDDLVYAAETDAGPGARDEAAVISLDANTRVERFRIDVPPMNESYHLDALRAPGPFAANGVIVLSIINGSEIDTVGYDASTGEEIWRRPGDEVLVAANGDGYVLVAEASPSDCDSGACRDTRLMTALDRTTGESLQWTVDEPEATWFWPLEGLLVVSRGTRTDVFTAVALDPVTGEHLWDASTLEGVNVTSGGDVVVGIDGHDFDATEGTARAVDASSGDELWTSTVRLDVGGLQPQFGLASLGALAADDARVYVRRAGATVALEAQSGDVVWEIEGDTAPLHALDAGVLGIGGDSLHLLAADDGSELWTTPVGDTSRITNVIATEDVILVSWS